MDSALNELYENDYPRARIIGGTISVVTGAVTGMGGFLLVLNNNIPSDQSIAGAIGMGAGIATGVDGLVRLFGRSSIELLYPHYHNYPPGHPAEYGGRTKLQYGEHILSTLAADARTARFLRAGLDVVSSASYFYLYLQRNNGPWAYRTLIYPGAAMAAIALYRFLRSSPEERAWSHYLSGVSHPGDDRAELDFIVTFAGAGPFVGASIAF